MRRFQLLQIQWLPVFSVLLIMSITSGSDEANSFKQPITYVHITNDLRPDLALTFHCKSKNNDLGIQVLHFNGNFQFHFRPDFWGTTQYYCSFEWKYTLHYFDIYITQRDHPKCNNCSWKIRPNGPCMPNSKFKYDVCYGWNPAA